MVNENHKLTFSTRIRFPAIPIGSWLILMTCLFWSNSTCSWLIRLRSFDIMSGAASIDQIAIWTRLWSMLRPKLPTMIISGSFQLPGPATDVKLSWNYRVHLLCVQTYNLIHSISTNSWLTIYYNLSFWVISTGCQFEHFEKKLKVEITQKSR